MSECQCLTVCRTRSKHLSTVAHRDGKLRNLHYDASRSYCTVCAIQYQLQQLLADNGG
jgi:hypothetical protein